MDEIDIRRANVADAAQIVFDAHRADGVAEDVTAHVEELLVLADHLTKRGLGKCLTQMRRSVSACRTAADRAASSADRLSSLLGEYVAHAGQPATTSSTIHHRFERARTAHDDAFDAVLVQCTCAGRLAAGLAALYGPSTDDALWEAAVDFLARLPLAATSEINLPDAATLEVFLTGLAAHVGQHAPLLAVIQVAGTGRFVQFMLRTETGDIQSVGDGVLRRAERLRRTEITSLQDRGFSPPDEYCPNWHLELDVLSVSRIGTLAAETLQAVHRFDPTTGTLELTVDQPADDQHDPAEGREVLLAGTTAAELAAALVERVRERVDHTVEEAWVTITQFGDHLGWSGHIHLVKGEIVQSELRSTADLPPQRRRHLHDAGWELERNEPAHIILRRRDAGAQLDQACADLVGAMVQVLDLDPDLDVAGVVVTYE
jgi:hypothetical protein